MSVHSFDWRSPPPEECLRCALCIGNFDGVHRGHRALIETTRKRAEQLATSAIALTFDPHPLQLLRPTSFPKPLSTIQERAALLHKHGADQVLVLQTDRDFLKLSAEEFFQSMILESLQARALIEGHNFGFGRGRAGNIETLRSLCQQHELSLDVVEPIELEGETVSSSRIRRHLSQGEVEKAEKLLMRPYAFSGIVIEGEKRGASLGFPTANLGSIPTLIPAEGVYAVRASLEGRAFGGAMNIGSNPTFGVEQKKVEVHLIDFQGDLYGQSMRVELLARLRGVQTFQSVEQLVQQLTNDVERARQTISARAE